MNNLERYKDRVTSLEGEVVGLRMVVESIGMVARLARGPMDPTPLAKLCAKTLQEKDGDELAKEFTLLRMFEGGMRRENELAAQRPDEGSKDYTPGNIQAWSDAMSAVAKENMEILKELDSLRLKGRQKEASRLILP